MLCRMLHTNSGGGSGSRGGVLLQGGSSSGSSNRAVLVGRALRVAALRAALLRYLRDTVSHSPAAPASKPAGTSANAPFGAIVPVNGTHSYAGSSVVVFRCLGEGS